MKHILKIELIIVLFLAGTFVQGAVKIDEKVKKPLKEPVKIIKKNIKPISFGNITLEANITTVLKDNHYHNYRTAKGYLKKNGTKIGPKDSGNFKLSCNSQVIKFKQPYFFNDDIKNLDNNLVVTLSKRKNIRSTDYTTILTATGNFSPVSITFPPEGYIYVLGGGGQSPIQIQGLKISWTPGPGKASISIYEKDSENKKELITPTADKNYVWINNSFFKPGKKYIIRLDYLAGKLFLQGQARPNSYITKRFIVMRDFSTI